MLTVIFRASARADVGAVAHQPAADLVPQGETVVTAMCGATGIGPVVDRAEVTCALCLAVSGQHPGKRGKAYLHRQLIEGRG